MGQIAIPQPPMVVSLSGYEELRPRLEKKLVEYEQRQVSADDHQPDIDARYKAQVLSSLLSSSTAEITVEDIRRQIISEVGGEYDPWLFDNAVNVIAAYVCPPDPSVGVQLGGTGLPEA